MSPDCICGHGGGAHSTTAPHACSECDCAAYSQPTNPAERPMYRNPAPCKRHGIASCLGCEERVPAELRPTQAAFTSQGYGEGSVANVPVERRTGERRKFYDHGGMLRRIRQEGPADILHRSGADRRSPGGAAFDCAVGGEGGGSAAVQPGPGVAEVLRAYRSMEGPAITESEAIRFLCERGYRISYDRDGLTFVVNACLAEPAEPRTEAER